MKPMQWVRIETSGAFTITRTRTPFGWLVACTDEVLSDDPNRGMVTGWEWRTSITFVFDPLHLWLR